MDLGSFSCYLLCHRVSVKQVCICFVFFVSPSIENLFSDESSFTKRNVDVIAEESDDFIEPETNFSGENSSNSVSGSGNNEGIVNCMNLSHTCSCCGQVSTVVSTCKFQEYLLMVLDNPFL